MKEKERCKRLAELIAKLTKENDTNTLELIKSMVEKDTVSLQKTYQIFTESTPISQLMGVDTLADIIKPKMCDYTLNQIYSEFNKRLEDLKTRKDTPITSGRINEMQISILYLQDMLLANLSK